MPNPWPRWSDFQSRIEPWRRLGVVKFANGAEAIAPRPNLALDGYMFWSYAPLTLCEIAATEHRLGFAIPDQLQAFYLRTNGAHLYGAISIAGCVAPEAIVRDVERPQPVDCLVGNLVRPPDVFVFGSVTAWSVQAKLGVTPSGEVRLINSEDVTQTLRTWPSFDHFVFDEMDRLAALHGEDGVFSGEYAQRLPPEARHLERKRPRRH